LYQLILLTVNDAKGSAGQSMFEDTTKNTRERVLRTLLREHRCTINDLALAVEINPISVRHHISRLQAEGLVGSEEERHGVGRPRQVYYLTESGLEQFPTRYLRLTIRLLQQLKENLPSSMVNKLFSQMAADLVKDYADSARAQGLSTEKRLELVRELLKAEGFDIEWEQRAEQIFIREVNCPYLHVGQNHPEICWIDQTLISSVLDLPAEKVMCVLDGDSYCTYVVPVQSQVLSTQKS
jgi:predicted ArsR family transcriptional regulator